MTLHKVDFSQPLWRYLYQPLYQRVLDYSLTHNETEDDVVNRFTLIHAKDLSMHLIVDVDENSPSTIKSHCVIQILVSSATTKTLLIHQLEIEKVSNFAQECFSYIENLKLQDSLITKVLLVTDEKNFRQLKKKYNLTPFKVIVEKL